MALIFTIFTTCIIFYQAPEVQNVSNFGSDMKISRPMVQNVNICKENNFLHEEYKYSHLDQKYFHILKYF